MFITKKHLERRTFLRGMGATMALPLLDAMIPARTALAQTAATPTPHMGFIYFPHGAIMDHWTPEDGRHHLRSPHHSEAAGAFPEATDRGQRPGEQAGHQPGGARHHAGNVAELRASARQPGSLLRPHHRPDRRRAHRPGHSAALARNRHRRPRRRRLLRSRFWLQLFGHHFVPHAHHAAAHGDRAAQGVPAAVRPGRYRGRAQSARETICQHSGSGFDRSHRSAAYAWARRIARC